MFLHIGERGTFFLAHEEDKHAGEARFRPEPERIHARSCCWCLVGSDRRASTARVNVYLDMGSWWQKKAAGPGKVQAKKKANPKFIIDCTTAETDSILDCSNFEKYLKERIKVGGKAGALGETVKVTTEKSKIIVQVPRLPQCLLASASCALERCHALPTQAGRVPCASGLYCVRVSVCVRRAPAVVPCGVRASEEAGFCCEPRHAMPQGITRAGTAPQLVPPLGSLPSRTLGFLPSGHSWLTPGRVSVSSCRSLPPRVRAVGGVILEAVLEVPCQEVLEEDANARLPACRGHEQEHLRAQVLQHPGERRGRGRRVSVAHVNKTIGNRMP